MKEKYYEEELAYLYESGNAFARAHPDRARFLNIDATGDRDPHVERLFEGFAFLAAQIREKIDEGLPALSENLVEQVFPQIRQEVPSLAMFQFTPRRGFLQESRTIPRGTEVLSHAVGPEECLCRFCTTSAVTVAPLKLTGARSGVDSRGRGWVELTLTPDKGIAWESLALSRLPLYLFAELPSALVVHRFLCRQLCEASLRAADGSATVRCDPSILVSPGGFDRQEMLLPDSGREYWGYALLREYFVYPEKFLFVNIHDLHAPHASLPPEGGRTLRLGFDRPFPGNIALSTDMVRLFCTPGINLFTRNTEPVFLHGRALDYRLVADASFPQSMQVHSLCSVEGISRDTNRHHQYRPRYAPGAAPPREERTFALRFSEGPDGRRQALIVPEGPGLRRGTLDQEHLSCRARCTNGDLPRQALAEGELCRGGSGFPDYVMVRNISRPNLPVLPPAESDFTWTFLSHLSLTLGSLRTPATLQALLRTYDWSGHEGHARRIDAISSCAVRPIQTVVSSSLLHGLELKIGIDRSGLTDRDDLHIFGNVLLHFFSHYVSINAFVDLVLVLQPQGEELRFGMVKGRQCLI